MAKQDKESKIEKKLKELEEQHQKLFEFAKDMIGYIPDGNARQTLYADIEKYRMNKRG